MPLDRVEVTENKFQLLIMKRILTSQSSEHISTHLEQVNKVATHTPAHIPPEVYHEIEKYI